MTLVVQTRRLQVRGRLGPLCLACSNTQRFWIEAEGQLRLVELMDLPDGEVRIVSCGRCGTRHSVVITHID